MPSTVNGIGTHYYGKKNIQTRPAICPHCNRSVTLTSYDTRLWFVIAFIPIIPIRRKRIIDQCPSCTRHYAMDLQKWDTAKQLETSGALEKFRSNPTPDNAIEAHRQLLMFHQAAEAAELQKTMCEKFGDNARVQCYLAGALVHLGRGSEAEPLFQRALELRPDLPEARIGVAQGHIRSGRLEEARKLLDFLEKPGAAQLYSLQPLEQLAIAYQHANRHDQALSLFKRLMEELPHLAQHSGFRKLVKNSESAGASILPKKEFAPLRNPSTRRLVIIGGAAAAVIAIVLAAANARIKQHRTLYIVNGLGADVQLDIPGVGPVKAMRGLTPVTLPEGHYQVSIGAPFQQEISLDVHSTYFARWFDKPVWVLDPGAASLLLFQRAVYSRDPQPATHNLFFGQTSYYFSDVSHPFAPLPESVTVSSGSEKVLTSLDLFPKSPLVAFHLLLKERRTAEANKLAEWHLRLHPDDKDMMYTYVTVAARASDQARVETFLRSGLTNRPVHIAWHRVYQDLIREGERRQQLLGVYEDYLKAEPTNSALLYLCGRLCGDHARGAALFERARQADPNNPYPAFALGFDRAALGKWDEAKPLLDRAVELSPRDEQFREEWLDACLALGQYDQAEKVFREALQREPMDLRATSHLCDLLLAKGDRKEAEVVLANLERAARLHAGESTAQVRSLAQYHFLYTVADFAGLEKAARQDRSDAGKFALFTALIEQNRLDEAAKLYSISEIQNPLVLLAVDLAFNLGGKAADAGPWREATLKLLRCSGADSVRSAALLEGKAEPTPAALDDIISTPQLKAVLLADLAVTHPASRAQLAEAARRLNVNRTFPYHLIQRATARP